MHKAGATEDDVDRGFFMLPFQAAYFTERIPSAQAIARFIKTMAVHYTSQGLNRALYEHFKKHTIDEPLTFTILRPLQHA